MQSLCWWTKALLFYKLLVCASEGRFLSSNDYVPLLSFFLSPPLCQIIVLVCSSSLISVLHFVALLKPRNAVVLLCTVWFGMAPFSVCQSPNLASYFQKEERISCLKLVLSVALVCAAEHMACSGSPQHDINWSSWLGDRLIKCKKMHALSDLSALCFVYVMWCDVIFFFCASASQHLCLPQYELLLRELSDQNNKSSASIIFIVVSSPGEWEQLCRWISMDILNIWGRCDWFDKIRYCMLWGMMCERSTLGGLLCSPSCLKTRWDDNMAL